MDEQEAIDLANFLAVGEFSTSVCLTNIKEDGTQEYGVDLFVAGVLYYTLRTWTSSEG
jgi:hypothetical protein